VIYGLELVRAFAETRACAGFAIDVGAWAHEEGYFGAFLGSRSFCGEITEEMLETASNKIDGVPLRDALVGAGLAGIPRQLLIPGDYRTGAPRPAFRRPKQGAEPRRNHAHAEAQGCRRGAHAPLACD
jgi:hypothetical protein